MDTTTEINQQLLECPVCCENYNDFARVPRSLACGHSFCTACLKIIFKESNITCPLCQTLHEVKDGDINGIPKDNTRRNLMDILKKRNSEQKCTQCDENSKAVNFCRDCEEYICNECTSAHKRTKMTKTHTLRPLKHAKDTRLERNSETVAKPILCKNKKHDAKYVLLFCLNCNEDICEMCAAEKHTEHEIKQLKELYLDRHNEFKNLISEIRQADLQKRTQSLEKMAQEVKERGDNLKSGLESQFDIYCKVVIDRLNELRSKVDKAMENSANGLENYRDLVRIMQHKLLEADALMEEKNPVSFLKSSKCIVEALTDLREKISKNPKLFEIRYSQACTTDDFNRIVNALGSIQELSQTGTDGGNAECVPRELILESSSVPSMTYESSQRGQLMEVLKSLSVSDSYERPQAGISYRSSKLDRSEVQQNITSETFALEDLRETPDRGISYAANLIEKSIPKGRRDLLLSDGVKNAVSLRFQTWGLEGYWTVEDDKVEMFGRSSEEAEQCMQLLKETVLEKTLKLRKGSEFIVESDKWQITIKCLKEKYPDQVQIEVKHEDREVVIYATCTLILKDTCDAVRFFLRDNQMKMITLCYDEPVITFIMRNKSKLQKIRDCLSQYCLDISRVDSTRILLKGIGFGVGQAVRMIHDFTLKHAKPTEEDRFDSDNEAEDEEERFSDEDSSILRIAVHMNLGAVEGTEAALRALCFPGDDKMVYVVEGDIIDLPVEALVNAADKTLKHNGGLAKAIVEKGGRSIQEECTHHVQKSGNVQVGQVFCSDHGTLPCSVIIHAVGPKWVDGKSNEKEKLFECITNCLKSASRLRLASVAFPAVSSGSYEFPIREAAVVITKAVRSFLLQEPHCRIREIYFCDKALNTVNEFVVALNDTFCDDYIVVSGPRQMIKDSENVKSESERREVRQLLFI